MQAALEAAEAAMQAQLQNHINLLLQLQYAW